MEFTTLEGDVLDIGIGMETHGTVIVNWSIDDGPIKQVYCHTKDEILTALATLEQVYECRGLLSMRAQINEMSAKAFKL